MSVYCMQRVWAELARQPSPKDTSDGEYITTIGYILLSKLTFMMYTCGKYRQVCTSYSGVPRQVLRVLEHPHHKESIVVQLE